MKKNKRAFSLIIVMGIVLVTSLIALSIIEYIIPFGLSVSGMENSTKSYYLANAGIEDGIYNLKKEAKNDDSRISENKYYINDFTEVSSESIVKSNNVAMARSIDYKGIFSPEPGKGESNYDKNFNALYIGNPIQMDVKGINLDGLELIIRIPRINLETLTLNDTKPYVSWQLSSDRGFINSTSVSSIGKDTINNSIIIVIGNQVGDGFLNGTKVTGKSLKQAYNDFLCSSNSCILKFSIINRLQAIKGLNSIEINIPYLEWKLDNSGREFKKRYADINSQGKFNGYSRELEVKVPQVTVNEAFDFTVFQ